jgi:preprotein translocase subunit SecB
MAQDDTQGGQGDGGAKQGGGQPDPNQAGANQTQQGGGQQQQRGIQIHTQYVKDLSFENPNAPHVYVNMKESPSASVSIDVQAAQLQEQTFEVVINAEVKATIQQETTAFIVELKYGGLVTLQGEIGEQEREQVLLIEVPRYLFPFARNVISDCSREGGFPPLLINPVDFSRLYRDQKARQGQQQQDTAGGNGQQA